MTDPNAGTPAVVPQAANDAGTAATTAEGSEAGKGKPVDFALAMEWKSKAEKANALEGELAAERARLAELERARVAHQNASQQPNPLGQAYEEIVKYAQAGDVTAQMQLVMLQGLNEMQRNQQLDSALYSIPDDLRAATRDLVVRSNYQMSVDEAVKYARGTKYDDVEKRMKQLEDENKRLKSDIERSGSRVSTATAPAYADGGDTSNTITAAEYREILQAGGERALKLKREIDSGDKRLSLSR